MTIPGNHFMLVGLFLLPFVNEDSAVVSAALLGCQRVFPYWETFIACFLGMWVSDFAVYLVCRLGGRPLLGSKWARRLLPVDKTDQAARWFRLNGAFALVMSRFILGIRTALLVVSGLLAYPGRRFLVVTFFGALGWLLLVFSLFATLGPGATALFGLRWAIALAAVAGGGTMMARRKMPQMPQAEKCHK
jgi:membrane protein DedA with SNARE-associated domain